MADVACVAVEHEDRDGPEARLVGRPDEEGAERLAVGGRQGQFFVVADAEVGGARDAGRGAGAGRDVARVDELAVGGVVVSEEDG